jgi:hypothetical protein
MKVRVVVQTGKTLGTNATDPFLVPKSTGEKRGKLKSHSNVLPGLNILQKIRRSIGHGE